MMGVVQLPLASGGRSMAKPLCSLVTGWFQSKMSISSPGGRVGVTVGVGVVVGVAVVVAVAVAVAVVVGVAVVVAVAVVVEVAVVVGVVVAVAVAVVVGVSNGVGVAVVVAVGPPSSVAVAVGVAVVVAVTVVVIVAVGVAVSVPVTMAVAVPVGVAVVWGSMVAVAVAPAVVVAVGVGPPNSPSSTGRNAPGGNSAPAAPLLAHRPLRAARNTNRMPAIRPQNKIKRLNTLAIVEGLFIVLPLGLAPGREHYNGSTGLLPIFVALLRQ